MRSQEPESRSKELSGLGARSLEGTRLLHVHLSHSRHRTKLPRF